MSSRPFAALYGGLHLLGRLCHRLALCWDVWDYSFQLCIISDEVGEITVEDVQVLMPVFKCVNRFTFAEAPLSWCALRVCSMFDVMMVISSGDLAD